MIMCRISTKIKLKSQQEYGIEILQIGIIGFPINFQTVHTVHQCISIQYTASVDHYQPITRPMTMSLLLTCAL